MALTKVGKEGITGVDNSSDATAITIDSNENVCIGVTSKNSSNNGSLTIGHTGMTKVSTSASGNADELVLIGADASANVGMSIISNNANFGNIFFGDEDSNAQGLIQYSHSNNNLIISTAGAEAMRIDSNGAVLINSTARNDLGVVEILTTIGTDNAMIIKTAESGASGSATAMKFRFNSSTTGSIGYSSSGTSFNTSSDYRLKENVEYSFDATTELKKLKPCKFNFKTDKDRIVEGFLAHEVQDIVPQAITGKKDEVDEDDNPVYQGIDQSKLVPLLVKSLQEALAEIDTLKTKVAALEKA